MDDGETGETGIRAGVDVMEKSGIELVLEAKRILERDACDSVGRLAGQQETLNDPEGLLPGLCEELARKIRRYEELLKLK